MSHLPRDPLLINRIDLFCFITSPPSPVCVLAPKPHIRVPPALWGVGTSSRPEGPPGLQASIWEVVSSLILGQLSLIPLVRITSFPCDIVHLTWFKNISIYRLSYPHLFTHFAKSQIVVGIWGYFF